MTSPARTTPRYVIPDFFENPIIRPYLSNVRNWQGYIRFLGLPDRRDNPDIIIDRLFVEPVLARRYVSPDENPEMWFDDAETLLDALEGGSPLVLLGDPGIGKSTLLNHIAWQLSRPATNPLIERLGWKLPLPMVLRELPIRGVTDFEGLLDAFLSHEMSAPLRENNGRYLRQTLADGQAFLLLDGIDELGDRGTREDLREAVFDGLVRFPNCRWLLSSRIVGYDEVPFEVRRFRLSQEFSRDGLSPKDREGIKVREEAPREYRRQRHPTRERDLGDRFVTRYIAPYDDSRIAAFARNWYTQREAAAQRAKTNANHLVRAVHADNSILRLARVPNLLTMMALIHRIEATLPHGRALLYERIAEAYLESIDTFRGIESSLHDLPRKKGWLARVGFEMQQRRTSNGLEDDTDILVDHDTVMSWLSEEMERGGTFPDSPSAPEFLEIVGRRSGLFLPRGEGRYAFVHLSFQEYFAAVALAREVTRLRWARGKDSRLGFDRKILRNWAGESIWRESFAFLFELLASEDEDDWHADLLDCVFGEDFSRLGGPETDEVSLNLAHLLARMVVNTRSGLPLRKRDAAIASCVATQNQLQPHHWGMPSSIFAELIRDDTQLNIRVFKEIGAQMKVLEPRGRQISLTKTHISDIRPLANLAALERLDLEGTQVSDIAPLANLAALEWLELGRTPVSDTGPLTNLAALELLNLSETQVSNISPLANLAALEWLDLRDTQVSDLAPLANLAAIEWLNLSATHVSNIRPLRNLDALERLDLERTQVSDIAPLANLTALEWLDLGGTQVSNIGPLANLAAIEWLNLRGTQVVNIGPLVNLTALKSLILLDTPISDIRPLSNLATLERLDLEGTRVSDIAPLANLTALEWLDLRGTQVVNIGPLANLTALKSLTLLNTPISDIRSLSNLDALERLDLEGTQVSDITPLANLTALEWLDLRDTQVSTDAIDELRTSRPDLHIVFQFDRAADLH